MPLRCADWMRGLRSAIGALALVAGLLLGLSLWSGTASAACPHGGPGAAGAVSAAGPVSADVPHSLSAPSHVRHASDAPQRMPDRPHKPMPPCCSGMACVALHAGLPEAAAVVPAGPAGQARPWAAVLLREGLGLRPDLPPPRLG